MDSSYQFLTLGIPGARSMPSRDVNALMQLAESSWRCDNGSKVLTMLPLYKCVELHEATICIEDSFCFAAGPGPECWGAAGFDPTQSGWENLRQDEEWTGAQRQAKCKGENLQIQMEYSVIFTLPAFSAKYYEHKKNFDIHSSVKVLRDVWASYSASCSDYRPVVY